MNLVARRVVARFLLASSRSYYARREARPDLYADLQKQFKQFQSGVFALAIVADKLADAKEKDRALDLIDDLPALLDATVGLPHEEVLKQSYEPKLAEVKEGLGRLEEVLTQGVPGLPPKMQRSAVALIKNKMKAAQGALVYIDRFMGKYAQEMKVQEEKARQQAEKEEQKAKKLREKAEKQEAKERANEEWCVENCEPCKDSEDTWMTGDY